MRFGRRVAVAAVGCAVLLSFPEAARAHVDLVEVGVAGANQVLDFTVGHGCAGADTVAVEIHLPAEITSVRGLPWEFGDAEVVRNASDVPIAVRWTKLASLPRDDGYYVVSLRTRIPDMPFQTLYFPATQTCRAADGTETTVEWSALPGGEGEPAPALRILPPRLPGWNRLTVTSAITDLSVFDDAEIVWQGSAAYSGNPAIAEIIATEPGVTVLTEIVPGADVWVRY